MLLQSLALNSSAHTCVLDKLVGQEILKSMKSQFSSFFLSSIYVLSIIASSAAPELLRSGLFSSRICLHCALCTEEQSVLSVRGVDYIKPDTDLVPALPD